MSRLAAVLEWAEIEWVGPYRCDGIVRSEDDWVAYAEGPINGDGEPEPTIEGRGPTIASAIAALRDALVAP